jgi:hypothetical protein
MPSHAVRSLWGVMSGLQNCVPEGHLDSASATTTALRTRSRSKCTSIEGSCRSGKANIVLDHRVRPDRDPAGIGQIEPAENDLVAPNLA